MTRRFGKYELHRRIGGGGMGEVWAARQQMNPTLRKVCALKVLSPVAAGDQTRRTFLLGEGALAARLRHGTLVPVFDVGEHQGSPYMAMELIDGVSLDRFLANVRAQNPNRPNLSDSLYIIRRVLLALHYVHTFTINGVNQRIIHGDVSPQNILVTSSGEILLTDFGLAGMIDDQTEGQIYGKLSYMPREQYAGAPVQQSDLFAAGAVFYEVLTGKKLRGDCRTEAQLREAIVSGRIPAIPDSLPRKVREVLAGLLEPDPGRRTQTAKEALLLLGLDDELKIEELYQAHVDTRHSWHTEIYEQAEEPTDPVRQPTRKRRQRRRSRRRERSQEHVVFAVRLGNDAEAPIPGREWEPAQRHDAAFDDITTARWARPADDDDTRGLS